MADESPGKVQALRAMFSEKNNVVMGLLPPGGAKIPNRSWRNSDENVHLQSTTLTEKKINEVRFGNKVLPVPEKYPSSFSDVCSEKQTKLVGLVGNKPAVGPKPTYLAQQQHQQLKNKSLKSVNSDGSAQRTISDAKSKAYGQTISSFMFTNNKENENSSSTNASSAPPLPQVPKPNISQMLLNHELQTTLNSKNAQEENSQRCNGVSSDNYVCKVRRKELPSKEKLGPAPLKPLKPAHMKLPSNLSSAQISQVSPPVPVQKPSSFQKPSYRKYCIYMLFDMKCTLKY